MKTLVYYTTRDRIGVIHYKDQILNELAERFGGIQAMSECEEFERRIEFVFPDGSDMFSFRNRLSSVKGAKVKKTHDDSFAPSNKKRKPNPVSDRYVPLPDHDEFVDLVPVIQKEPKILPSPNKTRLSAEEFLEQLFPFPDE